MGGSSKKQTVGYKYYLGMHMVLCHGPVDKLLRIDVDDRVAWESITTGGTIYVAADGLFGGESREGGVSGYVDIAMGAPSQSRNAYLQARLGSSIPAFRGVVSAILNQCYLGMNPYLKRWAFRFQRIYKRQTGLTQWYPSKAGIPSFSLSAAFMSQTNGGPWRSVTESWDSTSDYSAIEYDDSSWGTIELPFGDQANSTAQSYGFPLNPVTTISRQTSVWLRRWVYVEAPENFSFDAYVDNGVEVWVNGSKVITDYSAFGHHYTHTIPSSAFSPGANLIAIRVQDDEANTAGVDKMYFGLMAPGGGFYDIFFQQYDMNPAHIIRECLTDPDWGMGYAESDIDDTSFTAAADTLFAEGMGISLLWDRQTPIESFISEIIKHIDAALFVDRTTGKFVLKLIRDDYDEGSLILLDESNIDKLDNLSRQTFGELTNSVTVNYWDASTGEDASVSVQDTALVQMQNATINTTVQYPGFTSAQLASRVAMRDLRTLSTPLWKCTIYSDRTAEGLNIGDAFKMSWAEYSISEVVMRVTGIAFGDGKSNQIRIYATQDVFSTPANGGVAVPNPDDGWTPIDTELLPCPVRFVGELPYYELVTQQGQTSADATLADNNDIGFMVAAAGRPTTEGAVNAILKVDSGSGFVESDHLDFAPFAYLDGDVTIDQTVIPIRDGVDLDLVTVGTHCQIGDELCRVDALSSSSMTVGRGILDTVPVAHTDGDAVLFWDAYPASDEVEYVSGESIDVKILPTSGGGQLADASAPTDTVTFASRAIRPYPPAQVKINSEYYPAVLDGQTDTSVSWVHRDRLQQTGGDFLDFLDATVGPEAGTTYTLRFYGETGSLGKTVTGETGTSYDYALADEATDFGIVGGGGGDPYFNNVQLLLHCDGANNSTTFTDSSSAARTVTAAGNAKISTSSPKFGSGFGTFDGSGDQLNATIPAIGTQDFTIEFWLNPTSGGGANYARLVEIGPNSTDGGLWIVRDATSNPMSVLVQTYASGYATIMLSTLTFANGTWGHLVVQRRSGTYEMYINGVLHKTSTSTTGNNISQTALYIAGNNSNSENYNGGIDDLRITIGTARYNGDFTPPAAAFPDYLSSGYRPNGRMRLEIESVRDGYTSSQHHSIAWDRAGYGFNYGQYYGGI